ncbi:Hypothetical predicted protein [Paramuricea clavata]|uniref:Uncharacterized protein n=1 Tax=Paramuricea clavata TaxID=317549 RepID=A0A7D9J7R7_PARCT|nr:Hypothetical predicted protein [Paramuricea clavata]
MTDPKNLSWPSRSKRDCIPVEQVIDEIDVDASDVSLDGPSDESDRDEVYDPGNIDNLESSDSESDHEHLSEVNDESSGDDVPLARILASATKGKTKTKYTWRKKDFVAPQNQFQG